jgi:hypothetical protein
VADRLFDVLLTLDKNLPYQQNLDSVRIAVLIMARLLESTCRPASAASGMSCGDGDHSASASDSHWDQSVPLSDITPDPSSELPLILLRNAHNGLASARQEGRVPRPLVPGLRGLCAFVEPRTTDSLRPGRRGEFLARWCRACAACALLRNAHNGLASARQEGRVPRPLVPGLRGLCATAGTRTTDSLRPGRRGEFLARWCRACAACALLEERAQRTRFGPAGGASSSPVGAGPARPVRY